MHTSKPQTTNWMDQLGNQLPFRLTDPLRSRDLRIGVVGTSRSGKSVLLTAILDHLKNFDAAQLGLKPHVELRRFKGGGLSGHARGLPLFPYEQFRGQLTMDARWPAKTRDAYRYPHRLDIVDHALLWSRRLRLDWLDFPGERLADLTMGDRSYGEWADQWWESLERSPVDLELAAGFRTASAAPSPGINNLAETYASVLAHLARSYRPLVTPSVFLLGTDGSQPARHAEIHELSKTRPLGLSPDRPVFPLPAEARRQHPELAAVIEQNYRDYVENLASPLFRALARCDRILFAVNIPEILQTGPAALNDTADLITRFLESGLPPENWLHRLQAFVRNRVVAPILADSWRPGGVERVAFVATQADRVLAPDVTRLHQLLHQLVKDPIRNVAPHLNHRVFTCAAVRAAETRNRKLVAALNPGLEGRDELSSFEVSTVPPQWPDHWAGEDFSFPSVYPRFSPVRHRPPPQEGLSSIIEYLLLS